jgi:hypothetical protein
MNHQPLTANRTIRNRQQGHPSGDIVIDPSRFVQRVLQMTELA